MSHNNGAYVTSAGLSADQGSSPVNQEKKVHGQAVFPWLDENEQAEGCDVLVPAAGVPVSILPQTAIAPEQREMVHEWGFRNGYCELSDADGTVLRLSDKAYTSDGQAPTMQQSILHGSLRAEHISILSDKGHAVDQSYINTGGGEDTISISAGEWNRPAAFLALENFTEYGNGNTRGIGLLNSSLHAVSAENKQIVIEAETCGIAGAHSPGATSVATGSGDDRIAVSAWQRAMHDASLHAGAGNDDVRLYAEGPTVVSGSAVHLGQGDDFLLIQSGCAYRDAASSGRGLVHNSVLMTGIGDDTVKIAFAGSPDEAGFGAMLQSSHVVMGSGSDLLMIEASTGGGLADSTISLEDYATHAGNKTVILSSRGHSPLAGAEDSSLVARSAVTLGNGSDRVAVEMDGIPGTAVAQSRMAMGEGNDTLSISAASGKAVEDSQLYLDGGDDVIVIKSESEALSTSSLFCGDGDDLVTLESASRNTAYKSAIELGDGDDILHILGNVYGGSVSTGTGDDLLKIDYSRESYAALYNSTVTIGQGEDTLSVQSSQAGAVYNSSISVDDALVAGSKTITISSESELNFALKASSIELGDGDDSIYIEGSSQGAVHGSQIRTGNGDDVVEIQGDITSSGGSDGPLIHLGSGNDVLRLRGGSVSGPKNASFLGGDNDELDFSKGMLGDVLSLDQSFADSYFDGSNAMSGLGFEALNLDFHNQTSDLLDLDTLLGKIRGPGINSYSEYKSLIITGDTDHSRDHVSLGDTAQLKGSDITIQGFDNQTFAWFTADEGTSQQFEVFIATGMY